MNLYVVHNSEEKMRCAFYTVVIKNEALVQHYAGGLKGFLGKYSARCNNHITVDCYMGGEYCDTIQDLIENGLIIDKDFAFIDAGAYALGFNMDNHKKEKPYPVELGVNWLKARYVKSGIYVWYSGNS